MRIPQIAVLINWRNETNKSKLYSIYLRVTIDRKSKYYKIPVPEKVSLKQWSGKEGAWVKSTHKYAFEINNKIIEKWNILNELIRRSYMLNKPLTFSDIFQRLNRKGNTYSFLDYMRDFIANPPEVLGENTLKKYNTCLAHLKKFRTEVQFVDIDNTFLLGFSKFMSQNLHLEGSSCKKYMDALKKVIRCARKDNYIDPSQMEFMFDDLKISVKQSKRTFLEPQEIKEWKNITFPKEKEYLSRDRDLFLFQIYTGYYYKDLMAFTKDQLMVDEEFGYFIIGERDKNGNQTIIPLFKFPYASTILNKYKNLNNENTFFASSLFIEEPSYNRNLKEIAKIASIEKNISNKVARHTNAQLWVRYGAERPVLSKMMGHTKEETTKNYFNINIPEIVEGTKRVDFSKLGI